MSGEDKRKKHLLTIEEFVEEYGPSRSITYQLIGSGEIKAVKLGKRTYIARDAAEAWVRALPQYKPDTKHPPWRR